MRIDGFIFPEILLICAILIFICAVLFFVYRPKENFWDLELIREIYGYQSWWYRWYVFLLLISTIGFALLLAEPYESLKKEKIKKNGIDIEIVFDLSYSMIAKDLKPNRLEVAKSVFVDFVSQLKTDRVWLILFAWKPFQSVPLSYDYDFLKSFITEIDMETIDQWRWWLQGTAIGDGLVLASDVLLRDTTDREKVIILITDGEANVWVKPEVALKLLKDKGIKTYTIWVGKDKQSSIDVVNPLGFGQRILVWWLDEKILKKIAKETGGKYFRADSPEAFKNIVSTIAKLEKKPLETELYSFQQEASKEIILIMFFVLSLVSWVYFVKKIRF